MAQTEVVAGGRLTDWISLGVLASWVPADAVDDAVEVTGKKAQRRGGKLPPRVVAYLVMALALFADEDYEEVAARLAGTLADWGGWEESWGRVPTSGGITQARQRLGPEPMAELFSQVARPVATMETAGAFLGRWRLMSIDGMAWDVPDTPANAAAFGYPRAGKDGSPGAFPKAQVVTVSECASHAAVLAAIGPYALKAGGERALARRLYPRLEEDWLLIADRGFYDWQDWCTAAEHRGGAAVAVQVRHPASRAGDPPRRLLPVRPGHPEGQGRGPAGARRGRPGRGGPGPRQGPARPRRGVRDPRPRRRRRADRPGHHHHRPAGGPGGRAGRGLPPKMGARDRERPAQDLPARARAGSCARSPRT